MHVPSMVKVLLHHREFVQTDILDGSPHNRQATGFGREHVDLIGALAHIDFPDSQSHWSSECVGACSEERHKMSRDALHPQPSCGLPLDSVERIWLCRLIPDAHEFGLNIAALSSGDSGEHIALLMHHAALPRRGSK
jgi:hypothetical protein